MLLRFLLILSILWGIRPRLKGGVFYGSQIEPLGPASAKPIQLLLLWQQAGIYSRNSLVKSPLRRGEAQDLLGMP